MTRPQARRAINKFESFHEAYVYRDSGDPHDIALKELEYKLAREELIRLLMGINQ